MTAAELDTLSTGARIRDARTGATGTFEGHAHIPSAIPNGGGRTLPLIRWDGTGNAVPWQWSTDALELDR